MRVNWAKQELSIDSNDDDEGDGNSDVDIEDGDDGSDGSDYGSDGDCANKKFWGIKSEDQGKKTKNQWEIGETRWLCKYPDYGINYAGMLQVGKPAKSF